MLADRPRLNLVIDLEADRLGEDGADCSASPGDDIGKSCRCVSEDARSGGADF